MGSRSIQLNEGSIAGAIVTGGVANFTGNINISQTQEQLELEAFSLPKLIKTFKGREEQIEKLDCLIFTEKRKKLVICGIPGYGKTELSKQYASYCEKNKKIHRAFWVNAESEIELRKSSQELRKIYNAFKGQTCLFVFDNATNRQDTYNYEPPEDENFILLLTSIVTDWDDDVVPFRLEPLPPESVVDVYKSILNDNYQEDDRKLYEQLADVVGNVPLGLQVTGAYVRQQKKRLGKEFKLESYIETLKQSQKEIVNERMPRGTANTYQNSMYGALKMSLEKINNEEDIELRELAMRILYLCCYQHPDHLYSKKLFNMFNSNEILTQGSYDKTKFMNALGLLENFCFINFYFDKEKFGMHRFTQNILRFHASEYDPHLQSKCYWVCLQFVLFTNNSFPEDINLTTFLSHSDDNVITVYNFFQKYASTNERKGRMLRSLARYGCCKCLKKIFDESGDHFTKQYINTYYLLHASVHNNNIHLVTLELLLQYGGDVNNKTFLHNTPLHAAVGAWNLNAIKLLIRHNADLNARNYNGDIPLFSLFRDISGEEIRNMQLPLDEETPFKTFLKQIQNHETNMGTYGYFHRPSGSHTHMDAIIDILDQLRCEDFKNTTNKNGETLLHIASATRSEKIVKLLINKYNMDVDKQDLHGRTPLSSLVSRSAEKPFRGEYFEEAILIARELIMHGAKMDIKDSNGKTVITFAEELNEINNIVAKALCDDRCVEVLKKVFDYFGEEHTKNFVTKQRIVHIAVQSNQLDILNLLLQYDVIIKEMNYNPLHIAAFHWNSNAIRLVLQHDANLLNVRNSKGETPLFFFIMGAYERHPINLDTANEILNLLQIEDNKHITDYSGRTLLHASAAVCQEGLVSLFVNKYKIKTNIKDNSGNTPLQVFISTLVALSVNKYKIKTNIKDNSVIIPSQVFTSNLSIKYVDKENVIKIVRILGDCDDQLDDIAIYTLAQSLIKENGGDVEKILPCLK